MSWIGALGETLILAERLIVLPWALTDGCSPFDWQQEFPELLWLCGGFMLRRVWSPATALREASIHPSRSLWWQTLRIYKYSRARTYAHARTRYSWGPHTYSDGVNKRGSRRHFDKQREPSIKRLPKQFLTFGHVELCFFKKGREDTELLSHENCCEVHLLILIYYWCPLLFKTLTVFTFSSSSSRPSAAAKELWGQIFSFIL